MTAECSGQTEQHRTSRAVFCQGGGEDLPGWFFHMDSFIMLLQSQVESITPPLQPGKVLWFSQLSDALQTSSPREVLDFWKLGWQGGLAYRSETGPIYIVHLFWSTLCYFIPFRCNQLLTSVKSLSGNSYIALGYWSHESIISLRGTNWWKNGKIRAEGVSICVNSHRDGRTKKYLLLNQHNVPFQPMLLSLAAPSLRCTF